MQSKSVKIWNKPSEFFTKLKGRRVNRIKRRVLSLLFPGIQHLPQDKNKIKITQLQKLIPFKGAWSRFPLLTTIAAAVSVNELYWKNLEFFRETITIESAKNSTGFLQVEISHNTTPKAQISLALENRPDSIVSGASHFREPSPGASNWKKHNIWNKKKEKF